MATLNTTAFVFKKMAPRFPEMSREEIDVDVDECLEVVGRKQGS